MKYYIRQNNEWQRIYVEIEPKYTKAFDTTNDALTCVLKANSKEDAYLPMTPLKIEETVGNNTETTILWIIGDTVDVFTTKPLLYKHTLSVVQYRYFLNKHLVRNTVFNQPRKNKVQLYGAVSNFLHVTGGSSDGWDFAFHHLAKSSTTYEPNYWSDKLPLTSHTKVKTFSYKMKLFVGYANFPQFGDDAGKLFEVSELDNPYVYFTDDCYFELVDIKNNNYSLGKIYITENLFNEEIADNVMLETIRTYISSHSNAVLAFRYWKDGVDPAYQYSPDEFCFVRNTENRVPPSTPGSGEPIEYHEYTYVRYVTCQLYVNLEIYNYTMYDVLDILLKQNELTSANYGSKREHLFNLPAVNSDLGQLLNTTYPKDTLSLTQATFYDALTEVFRYYDAGFKFDENKNLQIEYYNDPQNEITPKFVGRQVSHSDRNFNNGRVLNYQNAILPIKIPRLTVRSQGLGVPGQNDFGILLEKPIYNINKLEVDVWGNLTIEAAKSQTGTNTFNVKKIQLDITPFVLNENEWSTLNKADPDNFYNGDLTTKYQVTNLHFTRGGNFIPLGETYQNQHNQTKYIFDNVLAMAASRFIGYGQARENDEPKKIANPSANTYTQQVFNIEYLIMNNGRSETETSNYKYRGQQLVNQSDGLIDISKVGLNIFGESLKDGEPVLTANCTVTDWEHRIREGDYFKDANNNNIWVANIVTYNEIAEGKYRCSVEFSKNFNALSLRVSSDKEKRLTSVSSENAVISEDNYIDYIYVCKDSDLDNYTSEMTVLEERTFSSMISQTFKGSVLYDTKDINFGAVTTYDLLSYVNTYGADENGIPIEATKRMIPIIKYGLGNCICFEAQFNDALSAGNQLKVSQGWFGSNKYFSSAALYTDDEGWADKIDLSFCALTELGESNSIGTYPVIDPIVIPNFVKLVSSINKLDYYKKPNEIFALNYEWCLIVPKNRQNTIFVGNKFINENIFTNREAIKTKKFKIRYVASGSSNNEKYSILDVKGFGSTVDVTQIIVDTITTNHKVKVGFKTSSAISAKTWAVVDENNDIYFASNDPAEFSNIYNNYQLGFFFSRTRKDL